jgi:trigger factor
MQTSVETLGQLERRLNVAVPLDAIEAEVAKRLARIAKNVKVPGFRPGHVPMKMVAAQYGPQVRSDVISDTVQATFNEAIRSQNLRIAGFPRIEPKASSGTDGEGQLEFSAVFEVYPEIKIGDFSDVTITRPNAEADPENVEETIEVLRRQRATFMPAEGGAAEGDRVTVDFSGRIDGVEFPGGQANDFAINIGEGKMLPEFETALTGMRAGEDKTFRLTFPDDYHGREVAGKEAEFTLHVRSVGTPVLPPVDAEFAHTFGVASGDLDELRSEIHANLKLELKRKIAAKIKEQALAALRAKAEFAVPRALVEQEAQNMARKMAEDLARQGLKAEDMKLSPELFHANAQERVALALAIGEVVRAHGLQARPDQVKALVQEAAQTYEQPEAVVRWHYEKPERLNEFEALAVEQNVVDWVLAQARVEDVPTTFAALMGPARQ